MSVFQLKAIRVRAGVPIVQQLLQPSGAFPPIRPQDYATIWANIEDTTDADPFYMVQKNARGLKAPTVITTRIMTPGSSGSQLGTRRVDTRRVSIKAAMIEGFDRSKLDKHLYSGAPALVEFEKTNGDKYYLLAAVCKSRDSAETVNRAMSLMMDFESDWGYFTCPPNPLLTGGCGDYARVSGAVTTAMQASPIFWGLVLDNADIGSLVGKEFEITLLQGTRNLGTVKWKGSASMPLCSSLYVIPHPIGLATVQGVTDNSRAYETTPLTEGLILNTIQPELESGTTYTLNVTAADYGHFYWLIENKPGLNS